MPTSRKRKIPSKQKARRKQEQSPGEKERLIRSLSKLQASFTKLQRTDETKLHKFIPINSKGDRCGICGRLKEASVHPQPKSKS